LLIDYFTSGECDVIVYEFISFMGQGVFTFADFLNRILRDDLTLDRFNDIALEHAEEVFDKVLQGWHACKSDLFDTRHCYGDSRGIELLREVSVKIGSMYSELAAALDSNSPRDDLRLDLGLRGGPLTLTNPIYVMDCLLRRQGELYYEHRLSTAVVHGDLHTGNIVRRAPSTDYSPEGWKVIDFAKVSKSAHLAQDAARLECDIKFRQVSIEPLQTHFNLEFLLAKKLEGRLNTRSKNIAVLDKRVKLKDRDLPRNFQIIGEQVESIRKVAFKNLRVGQRHGAHNRYVDYSIGLLMQSLMFVRYLGNPIRILQAWLSACLTATVVAQCFKEAKDDKIDMALRGVNDENP
jgi:hypothetical protein